MNSQTFHFGFLYYLVNSLQNQNWQYFIIINHQKI